MLNDVLSHTRRRLAVLVLALAGVVGSAQAGAWPQASVRASAVFCTPARAQTADQQDRVLRFAQLVDATLRAAGTQVAVISRSGLDLSRFGVQLSHSGVLLPAGEDGRASLGWRVRQLYYDCDEARPRLFDQGLAGFIVSADAPEQAFVSAVLLPPAPAAALQAAALDPMRAGGLLGARYSANAYPFSVRYQNCNQWVAELLALAWPPSDAVRPPAEATTAALRQQAQAWLRASGYEPSALSVDSHGTKFLASLMPLVHLDDHPPEVQLGLSFQVSLPEAIEAYLRARVPAARRVALCHDGAHVVVREGWRPWSGRCVVEAGDRVIPF